jgi:electron-transferring-flavoprotein dehydrogenase
MPARESMEFDIVIVGAGPAGLSAAIRLATLCKDQPAPPTICILEKGASVGAHLLSGAVLEPRALDELLPNWKALNPPLMTPVTEDHFYWLNDSCAKALPKIAKLHNHGNYIISIDQLAIWLADIAQSLGVSIFPGFAASELLFDESGKKIIGVATGDMGRDKNAEPTERFQPGIELLAKQTLFAEGARGSLSQQLMAHFNLRDHCDPQTYGLGIKELWEVDPSKCETGKVVHSIGWPLDSHTYGGSFMYHYDTNKIAIGMVIGLDYRNPYLDPFEELQQLKRHPLFTAALKGGKCISYGARALNEGGLQSIPKLTFPGGMLIGCSAGFLNVPKIKGNHTAMKSGMCAADAIFESIHALDGELPHYENIIKDSWVYDELNSARNIRPAFNKGLWFGLAYSALDQIILRGKTPWTFSNHADYLSLKPAKRARKKKYPKPDGTLTFSKLNQVFLSGTNHDHNQPCHLTLKDPSLFLKVNLKKYAAPETRYCPAGVYEIIEENGEKQLQINFQNCLHCKTCDIKDPTQNIVWTTPEGAGGPNYQEM